MGFFLNLRRKFSDSYMLESNEQNSRSQKSFLVIWSLDIGNPACGRQVFGFRDLEFGIYDWTGSR